MSLRPIDRGGRRSIDSGGTRPIDSMGTRPIDQAGPTPLQRAGQTPLQVAGRTPLQQAAQAKEQDVPAVPRDGDADRHAPKPDRADGETRVVEPTPPPPLPDAPVIPDVAFEPPSISIAGVTVTDLTPPSIKTDTDGDEQPPLPDEAVRGMAASAGRTAAEDAIKAAEQEKEAERQSVPLGVEDARFVADVWRVADVGRVAEEGYMSLVTERDQRRYIEIMERREGPLTQGEQRFLERVEVAERRGEYITPEQAGLARIMRDYLEREETRTADEPDSDQPAPPTAIPPRAQIPDLDAPPVQIPATGEDAPPSEEADAGEHDGDDLTHAQVARDIEHRIPRAVEAAVQHAIEEGCDLPDPEEEYHVVAARMVNEQLQWVSDWVRIRGE